MLFVRFAGAFAALLLASNVASAQGTKLTDPQIAHITYTAGQLDIQAARGQRCQAARFAEKAPAKIAHLN